MGGAIPRLAVDGIALVNSKAKHFFWVCSLLAGPSRSTTEANACPGLFPLRRTGGEAEWSDLSGLLGDVRSLDGMTCTATVSSDTGALATFFSFSCDSIGLGKSSIGTCGDDGICTRR